MSDDPKPPGSDGDYEVGYGRPPKASRFKPGRSGNPKGRPKGQPNARTIILDALQEPVKVRTGDRLRRTTALDAMMRATMRRAIQGSARDVGVVVGLLRAIGAVDDVPVEEARSPLTDQKVVADFLERIGATAMSAGPDEHDGGPRENGEAP